ncbi:MATE family efflux transporter [Psychromonas sp. Urea-02u-13]|uniref:MATE family efflux transporter n=1 Tax=Psychromonas sp. Urea-02u-13 TaxID=2058326 RepID=UPI000C32B836|nr:MATE family efflux transporter [Psychromonas sp. Urea-02u-13]PKG40747.1 MATE family efflux transporter [Psychromonas sp. Urea-02u-13]
MSKSAFLNLASHQKIFAIALPMMLSNISVPLLGLVDTAVIGHLPESYYLAGVAVGSMVVTLLFWMLVFLRMSTTGLVAQAVGANDQKQVLRLLMQSIFIALILAMLLLLLQNPLSSLAFHFVEGSEEVLFYAREYFDIRIWSAPAALINMVLLGWLLGMQNAKIPMFLLIITNSVNILLDILFVVGFEWGVAGVAWASLCADYISLACGLLIVYRMVLPFYQKGDFLTLLKEILHLKVLAPFILLNRNIFIRTLCLQVTYAFMTMQGVKLGDDVVSANAVLMHFLLIISFSMDGLAYAVEALVGKNVGQRCLEKLKESIHLTLFWATIFSLIQLLLFYFYGAWVITQITSLEAVQSEAMKYLPWLILIPLTSMLGFVFDGIFIGMTRAKEMRNSMIFSLLVVYFPVWFIFAHEGNHALWIAMNAFMLSRGLSLLWIYKKLERKQLLIL